jgi:hypothetical protein
MHCGSCENIPFWRWLKGNHTFNTSITCNDFDGEHLSNVQLNTFTDCFSEYLCTSFWKCYQIYCTCIKNIYPFFYKEKFENTKEVVRICNSQDRQHNGQKKKDKQRSTEKTKDRVARTQVKTEDELRCSGKVAGPPPHVTLIVLLLLQTWW